MNKSRLQALIDPACDHLIRNKAHARSETLTTAIENAIKVYHYSSEAHISKCVNLFTNEQAARENAADAAD
jgi:hypothetical protein